MEDKQEVWERWIRKERCIISMKGKGMATFGPHDEIYGNAEYFGKLLEKEKDMQATGASEKKRSQIENVLDVTGRIANETIDLAARLRDRLKTVMGPEIPPENNEAAVKDTASLVPLAERIDETRQGLVRARDILREIDQRLDL